MKRTFFLGLPMLFVAGPAFATGGFACETTDGSGIAIGGTIGHVVGAPLVGAWLEVGGRMRATTDTPPALSVGRSWIDEREIRVDLVDPNFERLEAQLRVQTTDGGEARGTLVLGRASHPVRCELE
jgi:hypothetical protein